MAKFMPEIIETSPLVAMFTSPNPGYKTLDGTHTYVVGEQEAFVIDPGPVKRQYLGSIYRWVRDEGLWIQGILLTHVHPDHALGTSVLRYWFDVPVFSFSGTELPSVEPEALIRVEDGNRLEVDTEDLLVIETPGHTADHVGFWLEKARIFFAGDTILGQGTTLIDPMEGDMALYLQSLQRIRNLNPRIIAPGHGPVIRKPKAKIDEYVRHRQKREKQLLGVLSKGKATSRDLALQVYKDAKVFSLALASVESQLVKLEAEGKVRSDGTFYEIVGPDQ